MASMSGVHTGLVAGCEWVTGGGGGWERGGEDNLDPDIRWEGGEKRDDGKGD
jgi:hypothetical protein